MNGIKRDEAEFLLKSGWDQNVLISLNQYMVREYVGIRCSYPWGIFLTNFTIFYKNSKVNDYIARLATRNDLPISCYTDGSGTLSNKVAGIGVFIQEGDRADRYISENIGKGSNNYAELVAVWSAIQKFPKINTNIHVFTDSQYAIGALTLDWQKNKNIALIEAIRYDLRLRKHSVDFTHVAGHSDIEGNCIADGLANIGRKHVKNITDYGCYDVES